MQEEKAKAKAKDLTMRNRRPKVLLLILRKVSGFLINK